MIFYIILIELVQRIAKKLRNCVLFPTEIRMVTDI